MATCNFNTGYMPEWGIDTLVAGLPISNSDFCTVIPLESSREGRPIRAVKIGKGSSPTRRGVLFVGGLHARELINPDALIYFAYNLADCYKNNKDLVLGGQKYTASFIRTLIENMDIFVLPLANPDGRAFVLNPNGERLWRGNRAPNPGLPCKGVDNNRNFDFLWNSGLGTSSHSCDKIYKGLAPFSEPETRNVRHLLDSFPHIVGMIDVHSYSQLILYPWGDDESQTTNPAMNFNNPAFKGKQGTKWDSYKEYIRAADLAWYKDVGKIMAKAIAAVRGKQYGVKASGELYPYYLSATSTDYSYSRHRVNAAKRKVFAFCIETGADTGDDLKSFQPAFPEAACIMDDVQPALMEFCLQILCTAQQLIDSVVETAQMAAASTPGAESAQTPSRAGLKIAKLLQQNRNELIELARKDVRLWRQAIVVLERVMPLVQSYQETQPQVPDKALIRRVDTLLSRLGEKGSPKLRRAMRSMQQDLQFFEGRTAIEGLRAADAKPRRRK